MSRYSSPVLTKTTYGLISNEILYNIFRDDINDLTILSNNLEDTTDLTTIEYHWDCDPIYFMFIVIFNSNIVLERKYKKKSPYVMFACLDQLDTDLDIQEEDDEEEDD